MDSLSHLWIRAANKCRTNEGQGECIDKSKCQGISTPDVCPNDPVGIQCCLVHTCEVPVGDGICVSAERDGCPEGDLVPGTTSPYPCIGPDDIQCCVKSTDMTTATSSSSVPTTSSGPITTSDASTENSNASSESTPTNTSPADVAATASPTPMETSETGLSGGQIGGISAGAAVAGTLIVVSLVLMYMRQRRRIKQLEGQHGGKPPPVAEVPAEGDKKADAELVGSPISPGASEPPRDMKHPFTAPRTGASPTELDPQSPSKFSQTVQIPVELPASSPTGRKF